MVEKNVYISQLEKETDTYLTYKSWWRKMCISSNLRKEQILILL
jgi:hypothetical protein